MIKKITSLIVWMIGCPLAFLIAHESSFPACHLRASQEVLHLEGDTIDAKAAQLAYHKLKGGHYDPQLQAVIPHDIAQTEREWKKAKDYIACLIGPLPHFAFEKSSQWRNSAETIAELLQDAHVLAPSFKEDFQRLAASIGARAYFGPDDRNIVKTSSSLSDKVKRDAIEQNLKEEEALAQISDALRGTIIVDDFFQIPVLVTHLVYYARERDAQMVFKNLWREERESGYVGIHAKMLLPLPMQDNQTEQRYLLAEMQIHFRSIEDGTEHSTKEREHSIYEQVRAVKTRSKEVAAASKLLFLTAMQEILGLIDHKEKLHSS